MHRSQKHSRRFSLIGCRDLFGRDPGEHASQSLHLDDIRSPRFTFTVVKVSLPMISSRHGYPPLRRNAHWKVPARESHRILCGSEFPGWPTPTSNDLRASGTPSTSLKDSFAPGRGHGSVKRKQTSPNQTATTTMGFAPPSDAQSRAIVRETARNIASEYLPPHFDGKQQSPAVSSPEARF